MKYDLEDGCCCVFLFISSHYFVILKLFCCSVAFNIIVGKIDYQS